MAGGWPLTQPNYHFSMGGKSCALALLNIIPKFPKEKHKFLSDLSSKFSTFMSNLCVPYVWLLRDPKCFLENFVSQKNDVCDESPPKRRTLAETFAWRLRRWVTEGRNLRTTDMIHNMIKLPASLTNHMKLSSTITWATVTWFLHKTWQWWISEIVYETLKNAPMGMLQASFCVCVQPMRDGVTL